MGWRGLRAKGSGTALWTWSRRRYSLTLHRSPSGVQNKWRFVNQLVLLEHKYRALTLSHWALRVAASTLWRYQNVDRYGYTDFFDNNTIPRLFLRSDFDQICQSRHFVSKTNLFYRDIETLKNGKNLETEILQGNRVAEVVRGHGGAPPKSMDSDENFKPEHKLFCRELRFGAIYALFFGDFWA